MATPIPPANGSAAFEGDGTTLDPISDEMHAMLTFGLGLCSAGISVLGIGANIANLVTFTRMGFKDTINISLTALAATDLASMVCLLCNIIFYTPQVYQLLSDTIDVKQIDLITQGISKSYLTTVAGFITSLVAAERCLCVLMPLKVKVVVTRDRSVRVLVAIFVLVSVPFVPFCFTNRLGPVFMPDRNKTIISLIRNPDLFYIESICFVIIVFLYVSCYVIVFVSTVIIVWKLASQSAWRAAKTTDNAQQAPAGNATGSTTGSGGSGTKDGSGSEKKAGALSGRDLRATKTVTFIAAMFIVCSFSSAAALLAMVFLPEFNKGTVLNNLFDVVWSVIYVLEGISSTANIAIYLKTSAKYREAFVAVCRSKSHSK